MPRTTPLTDKLVTIFGGSGFIGRHVAEDLLQQNARVRIAARNPEEAFSLKPLAKLGQLQFARCNILDEASVRACVEGSHAVVNLVGSFEGDLMKLMGDAAGSMAKAAKDAGARSFVQVSAIGADANGPSTYAQAKALGEELDRLGQDMQSRAESLKGDDASASAEFGVVSQQFSMLMNATNNAIKTIGEAMSNTARKQ